VKVIYYVVPHGIEGLSTVLAGILTVSFSGRAHWFTDGVHFEPYLSQGCVRQNISSIKDESWLAHHVLCVIK
jgi:hypothetical protein